LTLGLPRGPGAGQDARVSGNGELDDVLPAGRSAAGETLYRHLVEQVPAVVYIDSNDAHPRSIYVSPQIEAMFGRPRDVWMTDRTLWDDSIHPDDLARVSEEWVRAVETGASYVTEYRVRCADGRFVWVRDSAAPVRDAHGNTVYWHGVLYDITVSKTAEEELRASEARYRALIENIPAVVYIVAPDDDRKTIYVSPQIEVALGYSRLEWLEQPDIWMELLHPDDREETLAAHDLHNETGRPWSREYRLIASDGRAIWFRDVATLVRDPNGRPMHWEGVQLDITELKRAEEELRSARDELELRVLERTHELEETNELMMLEIEERRRVERELRETQERYRLLAEHLPGVAYVWDVRAAADDPIYVSPQIENILGYTSTEWGRADFWRTRVHPDDRREVMRASVRSSMTGEPFAMEYRYLAKDGSVVWVLDQAILLERDQTGRPAIFHGLMLDISDRKAAEAKAIETDLRYKTLTAQIPAITYLRTPTADRSSFGIARYVSPQVESLLGYSQEEWTSTADVWVAHLHPEDRDRVIDEASRVLATGEPFSLQYRMIAADGSLVWIRDEGRCVGVDERGRPNEWQGIMLDVTDQERAQQELRDAERRLRALVEQLPAMVYIELPTQDPAESRLVYLSPQVESILGYSADELMAEPVHLERLLHGDDRDRIVAANAHSDATGEPFDEEYRVLAKDGRTVWLHSRAALVRDDEGRPLYWHGVALDVTARRGEPSDVAEDLTAGADVRWEARRA
jgi:PAS domain S-box-containing protein